MLHLPQAPTIPFLGVNPGETLELVEQKTHSGILMRHCHSSKNLETIQMLINSQMDK